MRFKDLEPDLVAALSEFNVVTARVMHGMDCVKIAMDIDDPVAQEAIARGVTADFKALEVCCFKLGIQFGRAAKCIDDIIERETGA